PRLAYCEAHLNASGQTCRAALLDITERKQAEAELRISASVYQTLTEGVLITDAENRILSVNPAFTRLTGYPAADVLGQNPRVLKSRWHDAAFYRDLWATLLATGQWEGEIVNRRQTGEEFTEWLSIHTVYDAAGQVQRRIGLFTDISEQKRIAAKIWKQANYDSLTGLPNRQLFQDRLEQDLDQARRAGQTLAVLFIDLDDFKTVNDTLGHAAGDHLLVEAARRVLACVRSTDTVARMGGDEFTVIMAGLKDSGRVGLAAQAMLEALAQPFVLNGETVHLTASIGITLYPVDGAAPLDIMKHADQAMYAAKQQGNRFHYFTEALQTAALARLQLIKDLRVALDEEQFRVYFQPIVDLKTGQIAKAEALVRWQHPTRGLVSPGEFIPVAEECGLIHALGEQVFRVAAQWVLERRRDGAPFQVSVNKSPAQFVGGNTEQTWPAWLAAIGLPGAAIVIEVTEGLLLLDQPEILAKLQQFRAAGMGLAIDDFGTGYSALSYLKKFHADYLKIDISFIRGLETNPEDRALCEAIIVMAHKLGIQVIAEGVETTAQCDWLRDAGCDCAQGYLFARPAPAEAIAW
ncbi:MAG: GGDEF and EAL domain-containing protein, partial [Methylococcus sp.]